MCVYKYNHAGGYHWKTLLPFLLEMIWLAQVKLKVFQKFLGL